MPGLPLHGFDLFIVLAIALLIFGPKRLPEMGSAVGKTFKEFKKSMSEITESNKAESAASVERQISAAPLASVTTEKTETVVETNATR